MDLHDLHPGLGCGVCVCVFDVVFKCAMYNDNTPVGEVSCFIHKVLIYYSVYSTHLCTLTDTPY